MLLWITWLHTLEKSTLQKLYYTELEIKDENLVENNLSWTFMILGTLYFLEYTS
jgi:hypothetical protein